jgi:RHS repeat-associated protein
MLKHETTIPADPNGLGQVTQDFTIMGVKPGIYTLEITKDVHTKYTVQTIVVSDKNIDLKLDNRDAVRLMTLRCGDINNDGMINDADLAVLWMTVNYNKGAVPPANPRCDLNGDGMINDADLAILWMPYNYNRSSVVITDPPDPLIEMALISNTVETEETFEYNARNQLLRAIVGNQESVYTYRPDGLRHIKTAEKVQNSSTSSSSLQGAWFTNWVFVRYLWDGADIVAEEGNEGVVNQAYIRGLWLIAGKDLIGGNYTSYNHNAHGDVVHLTNTAGTVIKTYDYDAFGNDIGTTQNGGGGSTDSNPWRYCGAAGYYFDVETGTYMTPNRQYVPSVGRWTQEDPARSGLNWYVYCSGNPIRFIDPLGLFDYDTVLSSANNKGVYNEDVEALQYYLIKQGYLSMPTSRTGVAWGYFDSLTANAITAWKNAITPGSGKGVDFSGTMNLSWWKKTGMVYRTEGDITAGVEIVLMSHLQYFDISVPVANALARDVGIFESYSEDGFFSKNSWFASMVGDNGVWNLKYRNNGVNRWEETLGISFWGYSTKMLLNGSFVYVEDVGNITYGYLGTAVGFSQSWLIFGSSANHFKNHGFTQWANERADQANFVIGIN